MVQIKKTKAATPDILKTKGATETKAVCALPMKKLQAHKFNSKLYGPAEVKNALKRLQRDKCCFCEARVSHVAHGDVEHYRPKAGWIQRKGDKLRKPGYYWLAYDFSNLYLSCQICNQTYKKNYFPLSNPAQRALRHTKAINGERPLIIDPGRENPSKYLTFHKEMAVARKDNAKGKETIERTGLNRDKIVNERFEYIETFKVLANVARGPSSPQRTDARKLFKDVGKPTRPYSLMIRSNFPDLV